MREATAFWSIGAARGELRREALPEPGPGDVEIQTLFSGVSRGTESLVFHGRVPETEYARMRAPFQSGDFPGPVKYGYSNVGRVTKGPEALVGRVVFCLYPHQDRYVVPAQAVVPVPESVPPRRAVLAANLETALNALWDARPLPGDRVTVVGAGTLGCLLGSLLGRSLALDVEVVDVDESRRGVVAALGVQFRPPEAASGQRDLVFHASSSAAGLEQCFRLCRREATVVELSWYGSNVVPVRLGEAFHSQRLTLRSSQVGGVSPNKPGWTHRDRLALALSLLDDARLDCIVAPPVPFAELPELFAGLGKPQAAPCPSVAYPVD